MVTFVLILVIVCLISSFLLNTKRQNYKYNLPLKKNQLLTKHPIVFVPGKSTIFYFGNYWNSIPSLLEEHGHKVYVTKAHAEQKQPLIEELESILTDWTSVHIIADSTSSLKLNEAFMDHLKLKQMVWVLNTHRIEQNTYKPFKTYSIQGLTNIPLIWKLFATLHRFIAKQPLPISILAPVPAARYYKSIGNYLDFANYLAEHDYKCSNF